VAGAGLEALQLRGIGAKLGGGPPAQAGRPGAPGESKTYGQAARSAQPGRTKAENETDQ